ncbi:MAG TPA: NADPH-dependent FMN reductase [Bacteroidia bacterium]|nr:NADPH-dependent FMN reductase [Bacteroidia bacterium]HRH09099.1 NADPH-dependent FMN reductase [Bacteroidia bacterium]HRH62328.1 NADPH-dependent FMN reductase [Bacteroidia bacterium]
MITLLNATNRPDNQTQRVSAVYKSILESRGVEIKYFSLEQLPFNYLKLDSEKTELEKLGLSEIIDTYIRYSDKLIVVSPEYQGSFTGIFKLFLDFIKPEYIRGKKIALVGVSNGRAGNLRGLDHLTNIFNYLQANVLAQKLPISSVSKLLNNGNMEDAATVKAIEQQLDHFMQF